MRSRTTRGKAIAALRLQVGSCRAKVIATVIVISNLKGASR